MINREVIRNKVIQLVYAYYQNPGKDLSEAVKELQFSMEKAYHLYNQLLCLIVTITNEAKKQYDIAKRKAERAETEGVEMPSDKFINNLFVRQLEENGELQAFLETNGSLWEGSRDVVKALLLNMEQSAVMADYVAGTVSADVPEEESQEDMSQYGKDRELWRKLYKTFVMNNEDLDAFLEDKSLYWNDDKEIVDTFVLKTIKRFEEKNGAKQELLPMYRDEEDKAFAHDLFLDAIKNAEQYQGYLRRCTRNWDYSRIAFMDLIIMQIALAEMFTFPNIPVNVTINEYVNIAKVYSTPRSGGYVNGMLDNIARALSEEGVLLKPVGMQG